MNSVVPQSSGWSGQEAAPTSFPHQLHAVERGLRFPSRHMPSHRPLLRVEGWSGRGGPRPRIFIPVAVKGLEHGLEERLARAYE